MAMKITSISNPQVKETVRLYEKSEREKTGLFLIEGLREVTRAIAAGIKIERLFWCPEIIDPGSAEAMLRLFPDDQLKNSEEGKHPPERRTGRLARTFEVSVPVFERLTYRGSTGGVLAVAKQPQNSLKALKMPKEPLIVVLEKMEKPGNVGAILRTADAAGVDAVLVCDEVSDLYNPNTVRSSLGALFSVPTVAVSSAEAIEWLDKNKIKIVATTPHTEKKYSDVELKGSIALVIGSEKDGLSDVWLKSATEKVLIPMFGTVDSLNASVSAAVLIYEAVRQRGK